MKNEEEKKKFKIDRKKLEELVNQYREVKDNLNHEEKLEYYQKARDLIGTEVLTEAININVINKFIKDLLEGNTLNLFYSEEEILNMIEGLSNYEITGDWQHFWTVENEYLYKLPESMQEKFAENFSIGNDSAKRMLLKLCKNHISTTGIDVIRKDSKNSTNYISIQCNGEDEEIMVQILRKIITCRKHTYVYWDYRRKHKKYCNFIK